MTRQVLKATFAEAEQHAKKLSKAAKWPKAFSKSVFLMHQDGTTLLFTHAFARRWRGFVIVASEHNGVHVAAGMDLLAFEVFSDRKKARPAIVQAMEKAHWSAMMMGRRTHAERVAASQARVMKRHLGTFARLAAHDRDGGD